MFEKFGIQQEKPKSFEEQWENPEKMTLSGEEVEVYDIRPEQMKTPVPVWMAPGWTGTPLMYRENIKNLVGHDRRTLCVDAPHGIDFDREDMPASDVEKIPDAEMRKIAAMINTLEAKSIEKVDAVGHSEGCMDLILAAYLYPEKFRNIVLVNPAGMIGKDSLPRLMYGFTSDVVKGAVGVTADALVNDPLESVRKNVLPRMSVDFAVDVVKTYVEEVRKNKTMKPLLRTMGEMGGSIVRGPVDSFMEVLAISDVQIHNMLAELRVKGIMISVISAVDDEAFPTERMQAMMEPEMYDGFYTVRGKHNQFIVENGVYTDLASSALVGMQGRRERLEREKTEAVREHN